MAQSDAGRVIILPKGEYSATTNYEILDLVTYSSSTWLCKQSCIGITPTEGAYWMLFGSAAQKATESTLGLVMPDGTTITIDENGVISSVGGDAENVTYDNTDSGFTADNVQDAIDEVASDLNTIDGSITTINGTLSLHDERITALEEGGEVTALDTWLNKGNITTKYSTLADVLVSQSTINQLMRLHASVDYLVTWSAEDSSIIATFCGNKNAMDAIGEYDYATDKLLAVTAWKTAILASTYFESVFKDHVPTMTSNTTPSGVASASSIIGTTRDAYAVFDGTTNSWMSAAQNTSDINQWVAYKFDTPTLVKRVVLTLVSASFSYTFKIQASNDGSTWEDLASGVLSELSKTINLANENYYLHYRYLITNTTYTTSGKYYGILNGLQFIGRKMSIYVPKMTSNTTPRGDVFFSSEYNADSLRGYRAFDGNDSTYWCIADGTLTNLYLGYNFERNVNVKNALVKFTQYVASATVKIQGSNDGSTWTDVSDSANCVGNTAKMISVSNANYSRYRMFITTMSGTTTLSTSGQVITLQFYGSDYSESIRATDVVLSDGTSVEDALMGGGDASGDWVLLGTCSATATQTITVSDMSKYKYIHIVLNTSVGRKFETIPYSIFKTCTTTGNRLWMDMTQVTSADASATHYNAGSVISFLSNTSVNMYSYSFGWTFNSITIYGSN